MNKDQIFPIFEQHTENLLGFEKRSVVHKKGLWHEALQAHVIRYSPQDNKKLQILVQKRSLGVDISKNKFDQSLATQVINEDESLEKALVRGLREELGLDSENYIFLRFNPRMKFRIVKKYSEDRKKYNREYLNLFFVYCSNSDFKLNPKKVESVKWIDWKHFVNLSLSSPNRFTKTLRIYIVDSEIRKNIEKTMHNFLLRKKDRSTKKGEYWYYSGVYNKDILIKKDPRMSLNVYDTTNSLKPLFVRNIYPREIKVSELKYKDRLAITFTDENGNITYMNDAFSLI